ncbi:MAG: proton-conducting transporter membrane subunit, partial [Gemmatimonadota bacterium]
PQDMRNMGGLFQKMPITAFCMWIATFAIAGVWPFAGFFSKDEIIWQVGAFGGAENAPFPGLYTFIWIVALAAAMLTAFYMTRLMVMTFHGTNRTGEEESKHLHEVSPVMWAPLAVLAVLSVFGGWINVPEAIQGSLLGLGGFAPMTEWLHHWLEPVTLQAHELQLAHLGEVAEAAPFGGGEVLWAVLSTVAALAVVAGAAVTIGGKPIATPAEDAEPTGFAKVLANKYYVDELYDRIIVKPVVAVSRFCWKVIDATIIDGLVNLVGLFAKGLGWGISMFQTGSVNTYAFILTVGVIVILGWSVF